MTQAKANNTFKTSIHPDTKIGQVSLNVANLDNQVAFYQQVMGFHLHWHDGQQARLGTEGRELVRLVEMPEAKRYPRVTGLYHFAVLFSNRRELARAMARLFAVNYPNYPTDHILTKTTYLSDPEGNGIELYTESPEDGTWSMDNGEFSARRADGSLSNGREPLDVEDLFGHLKKDDQLDQPIPNETKLGHIHLHVRDLPEAIGFYHKVIGFDLMGLAEKMKVGFLSAGGYHHHVGLNTWMGEGAPQPPEDTLGMRYFSVEFPDKNALEEVVQRVEKAEIKIENSEEGIRLFDPSQNGLLLTTTQ